MFDKTISTLNLIVQILLFLLAVGIITQVKHEEPPVCPTPVQGQLIRV